MPAVYGTRYSGAGYPIGRARYRVSHRAFRHGGYKRRKGITRYGGYKGMGSIYGSVPKFNDVTDTLTSTAAAGNGADKLDNMSAIDIGTGPTDRNAQCVAIKSIYMNYEISVSGIEVAAASIAQVSTWNSDLNWQLLVVLDRQPNKAALTAALIWEDPTDFKSALNLDNRKRIKVLKKFKGHLTLGDRGLTSSTSNATPETTVQYARGTARVQRKMWMKFKKPMKIEYDTASTTGVIGDIVDNAISVWFMVDLFLATYLIPKAQFYIRTRFVSC